MKNNQHGGELIAFRIPPEVLAELEAIVKGSGRTVSTWARAVVLEALAKTRFPVQVGLVTSGWSGEIMGGIAIDTSQQVRRSWGALSTVERSNLFQERKLGGYVLPLGFDQSTREDKLAWLDANWPIKEGE